MALPPALAVRIQAMAHQYRTRGFIPYGSEHSFLRDAAQQHPPSVRPVVTVLVSLLNAGRIGADNQAACLNWLNDFALVSDGLRAEIAANVDTGLLDFYIEGNRQDVKTNATKLADTLRIERPRHYFDLAREINVNNGSVFIIGAGFSYDSYAPLLREMQGLACLTLDYLGVENPRDFYQPDDPEVWNRIAAGWEVFQRNVSYVLSPKEPSEQHFIIAELFRKRHITHIVSFNWDDLVEKAYYSLYNAQIPKITKEGEDSDHALWKMHGDISDPTDRWVLPYEEGRVFQPAALRVAELPVRAFVIGYREQEPRVREHLMRPIERRGLVTRIRPGLDEHPPERLADNAASAMKKIKAGLDAVSRSSP